MREHTDGDFPFANEWNAVVRDAFRGTHVRSGCLVTDGGTANLSLDVASGEVRIDQTNYAVEPQQVSVPEADPDDPRYDLVVAGTDRLAEVVAGIPSQTPKSPSIPDDHALLAIVEVPANATGLASSNVHDTRVVIDGIDADTLDDKQADQIVSTGEISLWYAGV